MSSWYPVSAGSFGVKMASFFPWLDKLGRDIVLWSNPDLATVYESRATKGWAFIELSSALPTALAYLVLVAYGYVKYQAFLANQKPKTEEEKKKEEEKKNAKKNAVWTLGGALKKLNSDPQFPVVWILFFYNVLQVALCGYMMYEALRIGTGYPKLICNEHNAVESKLAPVLWLFYVSKVLDFFDTIVIIVRGTWNQFSFLHTYHHFSIFLTYWLVANAGMDGDVYYTVVANSFVHCVMYFYYGLKVLGMNVSWDIMVTALQMFQFLTMNAQAIYILVNGCPYPNKVTAYYLAYIISLFALFAHFFFGKYAGRIGGKKGAKKGGKGE